LRLTRVDQSSPSTEILPNIMYPGIPGTFFFGSTVSGVEWAMPELQRVANLRTGSTIVGLLPLIVESLASYQKTPVSGLHPSLLLSELPWLVPTPVSRTATGVPMSNAHIAEAEPNVIRRP